MLKYIISLSVLIRVKYPNCYLPVGFLTGRICTSFEGAAMFRHPNTTHVGNRKAKPTDRRAKWREVERRCNRYSHRPLKYVNNTFFMACFCHLPYVKHILILLINNIIIITSTNVLETSMDHFFLSWKIVM